MPKFDEKNWIKVQGHEVVQKGDQAWTTSNVWIDIDRTFPDACGKMTASTFLFVVRPRTIPQAQ